MPRLLLALIASLALGLAACAGSEDPPDEPEGVSDEEYLRVTCTELQKFSDALIAGDSPAEIQAVIDGYIAAMRELVPPRDIAQYHRDFIAWLEAGKADPLLLAADGPLPPDGPRRRIAAKEPSVEECKRPTFFQE